MPLPTVLARSLTLGLAVTALLIAARTTPAEESGLLAEEPFSSAIDRERPLVNGQQTLPQLIAFALAHNPEISAKAFDGDAAAARTEAAQGAFLPRVSIEGGYTYSSPPARRWPNCMTRTACWCGWPFPNRTSPASPTG